MLEEYIRLIHRKPWIIGMDIDDFNWNKVLSRWEYIEPDIELIENELTFYNEKTYYLSAEEYRLIKEVRKCMNIF